MDVKLPKSGIYIVAVSGGVDSMVLLRLLVKSQKPKAKSTLVVGHFNHGIRSDSDEDEELVLRVASEFNLVCAVGHGKLGQNTSEEIARNARYKFLYELKHKYGAKAVITAHHQDDLIETAMINVLRGTGWRGLVSMQRNNNILRPLIDVPKVDLVQYAVQNNLEWREDETNYSSLYLRNRIRSSLETNMTPTQREQLLEDINHIEKLSIEINIIIAKLSQIILKNNKLIRLNYSLMPAIISSELLYSWLKSNKVDEIDSTLIERLDIFVRTGKPGKKTSISSNQFLLLDKEFGYITYP